MKKGRYVRDVERARTLRMSLRIDAPLRPFEVRLDVIPAPTNIAQLPPVVEILGRAAAVDQRVDGTRTADHPSTRPVHAAPVEAGACEGLILPIDRWIGKGAAVANRRLDPKAIVRAAGLDDQYAIAAACGQPICEHAPGRAGP